MDTDKAKKNVSVLRILLVILIAISAIATAFCGVKFCIAQIQYNDSKREYQELAENYITLSASTPAGVEAAGEKKDSTTESPIVVNFDELSEQAARGSIAAWLYGEGTVINYPVAYCEDNAFYLDHQLNGKYNACGTLFIDCRCRADFSDRNTIIYGHRMADGQMFNCLELYRTDGYFEDHPVMYINTPSGNYQMLIFSTFISDTQSEAFKTLFANDEEFQEFIDFAIRESLLESDVEVTTDDRVVTLVTCSYEFNNARTIVCGKLVPIG